MKVMTLYQVVTNAGEIRVANFIPRVNGASQGYYFLAKMFELLSRPYFKPKFWANFVRLLDDGP